ncbi:hypothetical protein JJD41_15305 [Oxynema sp. CENA135]|uniref:hypothetical protein n=1 Tax=Oxynema sp. CENA135 TaxID=984206 RepID=UPI00190D275C|nr:hypothetical protein [Oxynema sp. CENA135]MBK4731219.1 hypothetical protein [Oxynema sp. CENA135]
MKLTSYLGLCVQTLFGLIQFFEIAQPANAIGDSPSLADHLTANTVTDSCQRIGRVLKANENSLMHAENTSLCAETVIQTPPGRPSSALCFANLETVVIPAGQTGRGGDLCPPVALVCDEERGCAPEDPRSPEELQDSPRIVRPYNNTTSIDDRPTFSWKHIAGVDYYILRVEDLSGTDRNREDRYFVSEMRTGDPIEFQYPFEKPLTPGNQYITTVEGVSNSGDRRIVRSRSYFKMIDRKTHSEIDRAIAQLDRLDLSPREQLLDRHAIYISHELFDLAIVMLENWIAEHPHDSEVVGLLEDLKKSQQI